MDFETRLSNLEQLVNSLITNMNRHNFYVDSDIAGCRKEIGEVSVYAFPAWDPSGYEYFQGDKVSYEEKIYRCIQGHKSQADWSPAAATSLWVEISDPAEEWPEWKQPAGAHDAYNKGDKVSHVSKHWISTIDANVYEPGVYGWNEV